MPRYVFEVDTKECFSKETIEEIEKEIAYLVWEFIDGEEVSVRGNYD